MTGPAKPSRPSERSRDRDALGNPRNARQRDDLGRPLPRGASGHPPYDEPALPPLESLALAQSLLDAGRPFTAHEVLEAVWKAAPAAERELWRGLAQLAVGITHELRGNAAGARTLLERAAATLRPYAAHPPHAVRVLELCEWATTAPGSRRDLPPPRLR